MRKKDVSYPRHALGHAAQQSRYLGASNLAKRDQRKIAFNFLAEELARANTHLLFYKKLLGARQGTHQREFIHSLEFWEYTITANLDAALLRVCRVYDAYSNQKRPERDALHLLRFVEDVEAAGIQDSDKAQRSEHLRFLRRECPDQRVAKLRKWRSGVIAHRNRRLLLGGRDAFLRDYPLDVEHIQELVDAGFRILEWGAPYCESRRPVHRLIREAEDQVLSVLESLRLGNTRKTAAG